MVFEQVDSKFVTGTFMKGKIVTDYLTCGTFQVIHLANWFGRWPVSFDFHVKINLFCAGEGANSLHIEKEKIIGVARDPSNL